MTALTLYETARSALAEARRIDEVMDIRDEAERFRFYAAQAKDRDLMADASAIVLRAERKLGAILALAKQAGQLTPGRPQKNGSGSEPFPRVTLAEAGVDKKLSARSQKAASISERAFEAMVARTREKIIAGGFSFVDPFRDLSVDEKKDRRAAKERSLGERQAALPEKRYGVILADPEWKHTTWSPAGMQKSADNHYPTTGTDEICARPVGKIAARDCVLFLWAVVPMLPDALRVMEAWGFTYRSSAVWRKLRPGKQTGMGYWFRIDHELLLVGTHGDIPAPAPGMQFNSVIEAPAQEHSAKPDAVYDLIEAYFPNLPKIELNARRRRDGWDVWGLEAPPHDPETGDIIEPESSPPDDPRAPSRDRPDSMAAEAVPNPVPPPPISNVVACPREIPAFAEEDDGLDIPAFLQRREGEAPPWVKP